MPCNHTGAFHNHHWPTVGTLTVERCEKVCAFCTDEHSFKSAWFLRRHVRDVHAEEYPNLTVSDGWTGKKEGNAKKGQGNRVKKTTKKTTKRKSKRTKRSPAGEASSSMNAQPTVTNALNNPANNINAPITRSATANMHLNGYPFNNAMTDLPSYGTNMFDNDNTLFGGVDFNNMSNTMFDTQETMDAFNTSFNANNNQELLNNNQPYVSDSPWSTPQSARISNTVIEADTPTTSMDGSPNRLIRRLDHAFHEALETGAMTEENVLGAAMKYLEAFKHGRAF